MSLEHLGYIELPAHTQTGGFDHAAAQLDDGRMFVAHTANNAVDVIDCVADRYLYSVADLAGVAGVLVAEDGKRVFTSNRGENTVGILATGAGEKLIKVKVGRRPNGLAHDPVRNLLLAANVGDPAIPGSTTASIVDVAVNEMIASVPMPGRTRWAVFDNALDAFFINIAAPPCIVVIDAANPAAVAKVFDVPVAGPHGLDLDVEKQRLFCACDAGQLVCLDADAGTVQAQVALNGAPDAIFFNVKRHHLYVAIGDPGLIDVVDTRQLKVIFTVGTEAGAHTIGFDQERDKVYAFLPSSHRAAVYHDSP